MLTDHDAPAPPPQFWSWKKILYGLLACLTIFLIAVLTYDSKLEPYDDLKPAPTVVPDSLTNGHLFLKERWEKLPEPTKQDQERALQMVQGTGPWDSTLLDAFRKGRERVAADLTTALARKEWLTPPTFTYARVMAEPAQTWILKPCRYLSLEALAAARAGDFATALTLLQQLHLLSTRQMDSRGNLISYLVAVSLQTQAATLCCDLLDQGNPDAAQLEAMASLWQNEPPASNGWDAAMRGEIALMSDTVESIKAGTLPGAPRFSGLLLKQNQTLNRYHRRMRNLMGITYQTFPSMEAAHDAGLEVQQDRSFFAKILNPNFQGNELAAGAESFVGIAKSLRKVFFTPRVMRVRLALHQWRAAHPDQWPATLDELVPDYLSAVPSDPWNGKPLLWDSALLTIYAVGSDWNPDPPKFHANKRPWFADEMTSPGLRCKLPPSALPSTEPKQSGALSPKKRGQPAK